MSAALATDLSAERSARRDLARGVLPLLTFEDLLALPDPSWLVDGLIPSSGLSVLYGRPGAAKSFVALDWALSVATGLPWFGRDVERRWVVYVAAEGRAGLKARADAWRQARGRPDMTQIRWLAEAVNLRDREQVDQIRRTLDLLPEQPGLLVVDTMARTIVSGDESSAKDVGKFIAAVDGLRGEMAALVVHHEGHDGGRERGSSALRGAADLLAKVERDGKSPRVTLSCDKLKDAGEWDPIDLRLEESGESLVLSLIVEQLQLRDDLRERVLGYVRANGPASKRAIREAMKGRATKVDEALESLESAGSIVNTRQGWRPCPDVADTLGHASEGAQGRECVPAGGTPVGGPAGDTPHAGSDEACPPGGPHDEELVG